MRVSSVLSDDRESILLDHLPLRLGDAEALAELRAAGIARGSASIALNGLLRRGGVVLKWSPNGLHFIRSAGR